MFDAKVVLAHDSRLTAAEIAEALTGNTVAGEFNGKQYRQHFRNDGSTVFRREGEREDVGKWRTTDDDEYCAWWARNDWNCFWVSREGDTLTWHYEDKVAYPGTVLPGEQMDF